MNFFSKAAMAISTVLVARKTLLSLKRATHTADNALDISECEGLSLEFAQCSELLEHCVDKIAKSMRALDKPDDAAMIEASGARAVRGLRIVCAYYFQTSHGEKMGDFAIEQGLEIQRQWDQARPPFPNAKPQNLIGQLRNLFESIALSASLVSIRGDAERLASQGEIDATKATELSDRVASMACDAYALVDRIIAPKDGAPSSEQIIAQDKLRLSKAGRFTAPCEQAQIFLLAGLPAQAKSILDKALDKNLDDERFAALEGLAKELRPARGNNMVFVQWATATYASELESASSPKRLAL